MAAFVMKNVVIMLITLNSLFSQIISSATPEVYEGRHTPDIQDYEVVIPERADWEGNRISFHIPQYYDRGSTLEKRKRRSVEHDDIVHYLLHVGDRRYHLELEPNFDFMSPGLVIEDFSRNGSRIRRASNNQCHYKGLVKGEPNSGAALSVCDGMAGFVRVGEDIFFIEPAKGVEPDSQGKHIHLVHRKRRNAEDYEREFCGTQGDWEENMKARLRSEIAKDPNFLSKLKRRHLSKSAEESLPRYLESAVVVDKKFIDYYKDSGFDMQTYVLTCLNIVSRYYHDASIGNLMIYSVVRILYLYKEEEEMDLQISTDGPTTLESFCKWQIHLNPKEDSHPNHHDFATLLTRYDICTATGDCNLAGMANVAQACNPEKSCAIVEDSGITLGLTLAHEMGHVLSCHHDSINESGCNYVAPEGWGYVMSPIAKLFTVTWSNCSREFITEFLSSYLGECLLDEPTDHEWDIPDMPPGVMYSMDDQCKFMWRAKKSQGSCYMGPLHVYSGTPKNYVSHCSHRDQRKYPKSAKRVTLDLLTIQDKNCEFLWCEVPTGNKKDCRSQSTLPYDGTKCDTDKWCYLKKCVPVGNRSIATNGGWSDWSPPSPCSRTCGGGVSKRERQCNNPFPSYLGRYCVGTRYEYSMCNTEPCPFDGKGARAALCSQFDGKNERGEKSNDQWDEFGVVNRMKDPCELYCQSGYKMRSLMPRVPDGTPCKFGSRSRCIAGVCREVGCDWKIDSKVKFDNCQVCGGGGKDCKFHEIIREKDYGARADTMSMYYTPFFTIPADARNVHVNEVDGSMFFYFVVKKKSDPAVYYIGKDTKRDLTLGERHFGEGVMGLYIMTGMRKDIIIPGPTKDELEVGYMRDVYHASTDIVLQYYMVSKGSTAPTYTWEYVDWSECSALCGGGTQVSESQCVGIGVVEDHFCNKEEKPKFESRICNNSPCQIKWKTSVWGRCEGCAGEKGTRRRSVVCVQEGARKNVPDVLLDDEKCKEKKPETKMKCKVPKRLKSSLCPERDSGNTRFLRPEQNLLKQSLYREGEFFRNVEPHLKNIGTSAHGKKDDFHSFYKIQRKKKFPRGRIGMYEIPTPRVILEEKPPYVVKSIPLEPRDEEMVLSDEIAETLGHRVLISKTHTLDIKNNETIEGLDAFKIMSGKSNTSRSSP